MLLFRSAVLTAALPLCCAISSSLVPKMEEASSGALWARDVSRGGAASDSPGPALEPWGSGALVERGAGVRGEKRVNVCGESFTEAQLVDGQAHISVGTYIVGVNQEIQIPALLQAAKEQLVSVLELDTCTARGDDDDVWVPTTTAFGMISTFCGIMDQDTVLWFSKREEVKTIEADCQVHAAKTGTTASRRTIEPHAPGEPA